MADQISFPLQQARTRRFTLGVPRAFSVSEDGSRVAFLRSAGGEDPVTSLWLFDCASGEERVVVDARTLAATGPEELPAAERARRERVRETAEGIVAYSADRALRVAAFALAGRAFVVDVDGGEVEELPTPAGVVDPRLDPTGARVAYVLDGELRLAVRGGADRSIAGDDHPDVTWGLPDFVAAEEMNRARGFWWSPDGRFLLAERVDNTSVRKWHIANAAHPEAEPVVVAYPAAGTANADVSLAVFGVEDRNRVDIAWDGGAFPYLARVAWSREPDELLLLVQSRDQRTVRVLRADPVAGETTVVHEATAEPWFELVDGLPARLRDGRLLFVSQDRASDTRRLVADGEPVTPPGLQVRAVVDAGDGVTFIASEEPTETHVWRLEPDGRLRRLTGEQGVHAAAASGPIVVIQRATLDSDGIETTVARDGEEIGRVRSVAAEPVVRPRTDIVRLGHRELRSALLFPSGDGKGAGDGPLPVLLDPYGGPHAQRVTASRSPYRESQWLADQGFAVLVADGRGTPARGLEWEFAVSGDFATATLEDQVEALHAAAERDSRLDLSRVAIRGWSFGGYLAALAVLRRPDVFHAAVAGAPVTDWRLYDTHYTERYLGDPNDDPQAYRRSSLLDDAAKLERPLLLIHGLADDNVVVAHTLRLSQALMEAGRPHSVLPLSGVTHMTPQEVVAENLLLLQVEFLRRALGVAAPRSRLDETSW